MKFQGSNRGPSECETNTLPKPEPHCQKTCVYKEIIHFCLENIEWSDSGAEQKSGTSHLFNLSEFELLRFQILMIQDLWGINFHTEVVLALMFHLWFKLLSALCGYTQSQTCLNLLKFLIKCLPQKSTVARQLWKLHQRQP